MNRILQRVTKNVLTKSNICSIINFAWSEADIISNDGQLLRKNVVLSPKRNKKNGLALFGILWRRAIFFILLSEQMFDKKSRVNIFSFVKKAKK